MATLITQSSDPALWAVLNDIYILEKGPGHVVSGEQLYKVFILTTGETAFQLITNLDYIDSRSIPRSRKASYTKLDG